MRINPMNKAKVDQQTIFKIFNKRLLNLNTKK